jgi:hypothetical protein
VIWHGGDHADGVALLRRLRVHFSLTKKETNIGSALRAFARRNYCEDEEVLALVRELVDGWRWGTSIRGTGKSVNKTEVAALAAMVREFRARDHADALPRTAAYVAGLGASRGGSV